MADKDFINDQNMDLLANSEDFGNNSVNNPEFTDPNGTFSTFTNQGLDPNQNITQENYTSGVNEIYNTPGVDPNSIYIPQIHIAGLDINQATTLWDIADNVYNKNIASDYMTNTDWVNISYGADPHDVFVEAYKDYLRNPEVLMINEPEKYQFLKENVFYNKEFSGSGTGESFTDEITQDRDILNSHSKQISFTGNYKYCTPSTCSGWASDGEYINC
ncbi:MAG: hypothetical protein N3B21_04275 [Clostridia bacterium]|nr:hypothetical protein [Clostridia bacterium]